jgi:hypothetical protein
VYVILQNEVRPDALRSLKLGEWICLSEDSTWRVRAEAGTLAHIPRVLVADLLDEITWALRQPYIDWIGELSSRNDSLEWWASELAAKNPYNNLFIRICLLGLARRLFECGLHAPTLVVCSTHAMADGVLALADRFDVAAERLPASDPRVRLQAGRLGKRLGGWALPYVGRMVCPFLPSRLQQRVMRSLDCSLTHRRQVLADHGVYPDTGFSGDDTQLLFTWVDRRSFAQDGGFRDPHLGELAQMLRDRGFRVAFVPQVLGSIPFSVAVEKLVASGERFIYLESYIDENEYRECQARAKRFVPDIRPDEVIDDLPVSGLAQEIAVDGGGPLGLRLRYERSVANLAASGNIPGQIIHTFEGHSWEQALAWSVRRHMPSTRIVGYENGTFSRLVLSEYPAKSEFGLRPLPDRVVTYGRHSRDTMVSEGWPDGLVMTGCALRHNYLWESRIHAEPLSTGAQGGPTQILLATGIGFGETIELIEKATQAFPDVSRYLVTVKCHPTVDADLVKSTLGATGKQENLRFVDASIGELLVEAQILLCTYTFVCYEGLLYGVYPIFVRAENFLNLDKMESLPEIHGVASTPGDLRRLAECFLAMSDVQRRSWYRKGLIALREALQPIEPGCVDAFVM